MTRINRLRTLVLTLAGAFALAALTACAPRADTVRATSDAADAPLQLQRVVMLMRHGVRPPTKEVVVPDGYASDPWPAWQVPHGYLTAHGYQGAVLVGRWDRGMLAGRGLLPSSGCPADGVVHVWADTDERTRETGRAFAQGLAPGCGIAVGHTDGDRDDPLFAPVENAAVPYDYGQARAAILARVDGDVDSAMPPLAAAFDRLGSIMGCCSPRLCAASGLPAGCTLGAIPHVWEPARPRHRVKFVGPLSIGGTAAQAILLQYVEGKPMADVGWGRASVQDIELLSEIHRAEFDLLARTPYIADRASTPIVQRVLDEFDAADTARLTVLVGHDTNVANVGGMLDVHWHVPGYAADDPAVNGTLGFELLADASGAQFVRVFFQAQGTRQLRELQPLDVAHPPYFAYLPIPGCAKRCPIADFERMVSAKLVEPLRAPATD